jgi:outer membrane receptor protein involved in Fe transport
MMKKMTIWVFALLITAVAKAQQPDVKADSLGVDPLVLQNVEMDEVTVAVRRMGTMKSRSSVLNQDLINGAELVRAACCNLGESFTTNPSVDVSYSDAATGAKQIKLLGLSTSYVQMLTENFPNYRGAAMPYALGYIPGPWMQSIQVSKGTSSVKHGYEAIAGQINVEFLKPQEVSRMHVNLYGNTMDRVEANFDGNVHLNKHLSTSILGHYENDLESHDGNGDGFMDTPKVRQYNLMNRWIWQSPNYLFQAAVKALKEHRTSGQDEHAMTQMTEADMQNGLYRIGIETERYEAFAKNAFILNQERGTNIALILNGSWHKQNADYGWKAYDVVQRNAYASLMFETKFSDLHSLSAGLSWNYDRLDQRYNLLSKPLADLLRLKEEERTPGAYVQYTFNYDDKLVAMAGLRVDHSNLYGSFVTPRVHVRWTPAEWFNMRLSAGKGYRTNHVLAEHNYLLGSSREVVIDPNLKQEEAWNYGVSTSFYIPVRSKQITLNAEYYYTDFRQQLVVDMDSDPHAVHFTNLAGDSYSHTFQVEASYPFFRGFTMTAAYRSTDVKTTYAGVLREKALQGKYKGLVTASYQTPLGIWQFDATLQLNGGGRMPLAYTTADGTPSWNARYRSYEQLSAQVTRWFRRWSVYVGGENITNFKQRNPIIDAAHPWGSNFDASMVWGPVHGAVYYIGLRWQWEKM